MHVINSTGQRETVRFDRISERLESLSFGLNRDFVDTFALSKKVVEGLYDGVTTEELDNLAAETAAAMVTHHPDWGKLASRILVSRLHKKTSDSFYNTMLQLSKNINESTGELAPLVSREFMQHVRKNAARLDSAIVKERDYEFDYFGLKTLIRQQYLMKIAGKVVERPSYMIMRVAIGIHGDDVDHAIESYNLISEKFFTHATPTLFNAGTPKPQMSSCFLLTIKDDSIDGIYDTLKDCAKISQSAGGIGLAIHNVRAKGSYIKGTGGTSNGIVPMLRNFDMTARYVDQGGGKRKGSFAIYLEPWHADIFEFLELKKNHGKEEMRARDLFYGLWIPDLFMQRVEEDRPWSLFCPKEAPGLADAYGEDFERLYKKYEAEGKFRQQVRAQDLWFAILEGQIETGGPYLLYKDSANKKSNQQNLGTIKSSNLCTEIVEYTAADEIAVCNLASIALPKFVRDGAFDHGLLYKIAKVVTRNLNMVIDRNYYPVKEAERSNKRHRPIGIGVQGLADVFMMLGQPFDSPASRALNREISETIYFAAMETSMELAREVGPYETIGGSPISKGIFQFDMWGVKPTGRWNWEALRKEVVKHGVRNSLLVAPMPTATTSQILGNNECFEPYTSNLYTRRTLAGEFILVNKHLMAELQRLKLWNENMRNKIIAAEGSIQKIEEIPHRVKEIYRTVWEIPQKSLIDMSADRGAFICQSQSLNLFLGSPTVGKLTSMHFHAWKRGLKTGIYYLRTNAAANAIAFTVNKQALTSPVTEQPPLKVLADGSQPELSFLPTGMTEGQLMCSIENGDNCTMCGS